MRRAIISLCLGLALVACDHYPSGLSDSEQVQALIFEHLAAKLLDHSSAPADSLRLFLCCGGDPSRAVQARVARPFPSVRPCSAIAARELFGPVVEEGTRRDGIELRIDPFTISGDGPQTINVRSSIGGGSHQGFEYRVQRVKGQWKIIASERTWVS